jgi:hypothetical protein
MMSHDWNELAFTKIIARMYVAHATLYTFSDASLICFMLPPASFCAIDRQTLCFYVHKVKD